MKGRRSFLLLAPALLAAGSLARASSVKIPSAAPGGVARVGLGSATPAPRAHLGGKRLLVLREGNEWFALIGVPLGTKAGTKLRVEAEYPEGRRERLEVRIARKSYPSQHLSVAPEQAELTAEQLQQYESERRRLQELLRTFTEAGPATLAMLQPVAGRRSGSFGSRRFINGVARSPHLGMDFSAPAGTPVIAAGAGRILDAGEYLFLGRTLILDHGQGLLSLYAHLATIGAAAEAPIAAGATIGEVGMTGRATGPHLHFSVYLNAVAVDPAIFLP